MTAESRTHPKWVQTFGIAGILAIQILFASCLQDSLQISFSNDDFVAIAFPASLPSSEITNALMQVDIDTIVNENNVLIPMTDFVRLEYMTLSEVSRRVKAGDPRLTPLTSVLVSSFTTFRADAPWHIWYIPVGSSAVYTGVQKIFAEKGFDWAWDAKPPSPVLRFLWIIWLAWILWLLAGRPVKDKVYHLFLITAWIPLVFIQSIPAAALIIVGQGISVISGMHAMAKGRKQRLDRSDKRKLLIDLAPFLLSMLFLLSMDPKLLLPATISGALLFLLVVYQAPISSFIDRRRLHQYPQFRLILDGTLKAKAFKLSIRTLVPLMIMISLVFLVPPNPGDQAAYHLVFSKNLRQKATATDYASMIRAHIVYQEALTWGRLGDASWMTDSYTRPYRFELLEDKIVRGVVDKGSSTDSFQNSNELDKQLKRILEYTKGGTPLVVQGDDIPQNGTIQLDSLGVVFYIMALAPFCVLGVLGVGQSRRRIMTSYLNRQVA